MTTIGALAEPLTISRSPRLKTVAWTLLFLLVATIVGLALIPWQQTAHGEGRVVAYSPSLRRHDVDAPVDGRIAEWYVVEGSKVKAGDPIVRIVDNDPMVLDRLRAERRALVARRDGARISKATAALQVQRQKELFAQGLASRRTYELAEQERAKFAIDEANADAEILRLDTRLARQDNQTIRAPHDGTVLRRGEGQGSILVKTGELLATLVPDGVPQAVELWIDGNDLTLVNTGQNVRLQFEGWPAVQASGWPEVAVGTFAGVIKLVDVADDGKGKFRVLVTPYDDAPWPEQLVGRQGLRAQGFLLAARVTLAYELWRRFNGFPAIPQVALTGAKKS